MNDITGVPYGLIYGFAISAWWLIGYKSFEYFMTLRYDFIVGDRYLGWCLGFLGIVTAFICFLLYLIEDYDWSKWSIKGWSKHCNRVIRRRGK